MDKSRLRIPRSARQHDVDKHEKLFIGNVMRLAGCDGVRLPHSDTMKYYMEKSGRDGLASIPPQHLSDIDISDWRLECDTA